MHFNSARLSRCGMREGSRQTGADAGLGGLKVSPLEAVDSVRRVRLSGSTLRRSKLDAFGHVEPVRHADGSAGAEDLGTTGRHGVACSGTETKPPLKRMVTLTRVHAGGAQGAARPAEIFEGPGIL